MQDVVLPLRNNKPLDARTHLKYLRWAVFGVAVFIYCFSLLFRQTTYIYMFFAITAAIWLGGAGSVIVGGLYWKRGTTMGAYCALISGSTLATGAIILEQLWPKYHGGATFPINGQWMWFIAMVSSIVVYVAVSFLGKRVYFDLDRMLHRGKYAIEKNGEGKTYDAAKGIKALFGMSNEFTKRDVVTYWFCLGCTGILVVMFAAGTIYNVIFEVSSEQWAQFWKYFMGLMMVLGIIVAVWISIGGLREMPEFFGRLKNAKRDDGDDGTVRGNESADDEVVRGEHELSEKLKN